MGPVSPWEACSRSIGADGPSAPAVAAVSKSPLSDPSPAGVRPEPPGISPAAVGFG